MPVYGGKPSKRPIQKIDRDFAADTAYETSLTMNMHTGTHMDASLHMIEGGDTIDNIDLNRVVTKCKVLDLTSVEEKITDVLLAQKEISEGDFVLLKTRNSFEDILEGKFIYIDKSGAEYLSTKKIKGVGIDALGVERGQPGHETHKILMGAGIIILEGLRLKEVCEEEYLLVAAPLKISSAEAAPVRAILINEISLE
jgi:arylformamidase